MNTTIHHSRTPIEGTPERRRVAVGSAVGTTIENYDFIGYSTAAALYFGTVFFPSGDPTVSLLLSFATLGVGFAARPIGGVIGGYLGDRIGRKPVLITSLLVMGLSTFAIGLLPTYETIGIAAPIMLVAVRIIQGLAFGAEWGGAILMTYEHAPWRKKGQYTAIPQAGFPIGLLLANLAFLVSAGLGGDWAWRVPFLLSALLIAAGVYIRLKVDESPEFEDVKETGQIERNPILSVLRDDWRNVVRAFCLRIAETAGYAVIITYGTSYLHSNGLATKSDTILSIVLAACCGVVAMLLWGRVVDRIGRRRVYLFGSAVFIVIGIPAFSAFNTGSLPLIIATFIITFAVGQNSLAATQGAWFPELFQTGQRSSGASLAYQFSSVVTGFTAFACIGLYTAFGWWGPALLCVAYGLISFIAALVTPDTWGRTERQTVDAEITRLTGTVPTVRGRRR